MNLGFNYYYGVGGVLMDHKKAFEIFNKLSN